MKKSNIQYLGLIFLAALFINACAVQGTPPPTFDAQPIANGNWQKKAAYLYFVLDASSSMGEAYKMETARSVIENFNKTMPDLDITVALRSFGHHPNVSSQSTELMVKPQAYSSDILSEGVAKVSMAGGFSPLERALKQAVNDLKDVSDPIALIIVSDGQDMMETPIAAAQDFYKAHAGAICIYTVQVGNAAEGQRLLSSLAQITDCGKAVTADSIANGAAMNAFVEEVLLAGMADGDDDGVADDQDRCPNTPHDVTVDKSGCPLDSDKDGVLDYMDHCPGTPRGTKVDASGCSLPLAELGKATAAGTYIFEGIQFETGKANLKPSSYPLLNKIVDAMQSNPDLKVEIQGHTDNTGKYSYNVNLSQKRADRVKNYLESKGVDGTRITTLGFGPDMPIDTNDTKAGRAKNRRVEFKPLK
jgi:OOP family OmpA-OmpF porin